MTDPNGFALGVDNVRKKLDLPVLSNENWAEHQVWRIFRQFVSLTVIESWLQQNILPSYNSVNLYQKGSFTAGFGSTCKLLTQHGC